MNQEIKKVADPINANTRGAAWIAVVGLGEITFSDGPDPVQFEQTYAPDEKHRSLYDERYPGFTKIYWQMNGVCLRLNGLYHK